MKFTIKNLKYEQNLHKPVLDYFVLDHKQNNFKSENTNLIC